MENVIFKIGGKKDITVCVSFFPNCEIDSLFEEAVTLLSNDLGIERNVLSSKIDLKKVRDSLRVVSLKELIKRTTYTTGDVYEAVEIICDNFPEVQKLMNYSERYQKTKSIKLEQAETLALFSHVGGCESRIKEGAMALFRTYSGDIEVRFKMFLYCLSNMEFDDARLILELTTDKKNEIYKTMVKVYECYVTRDAKKLEELDIGKDKFFATMISRIKNNFRLVGGNKL